VSEPAAELIGPIEFEMDYFLSLKAVNHQVVYGNGPTPQIAKPKVTFAQPLIPGDPAGFLYDGLGIQMMKIDLKTAATLSQVPVGLGYNVSVFGIRPTQIGDAHEAWVPAPNRYRRTGGVRCRHGGRKPACHHPDSLLDRGRLSGR
jgi:hypothetical protein